MEGLRQGVFRILCAAILCALAGSLAEGLGTKKIIRFLSGVVMTLSLLSLVPGLDLTQMAEELLPASDSLAAPVALGEEISARELEERIIQETEAYILHKAAALGMDIRVDVVLTRGEFPVPESAVIQGDYSQQQKTELSAMMETELGITGEDQRWIG